MALDGKTRVVQGQGSRSSNRTFRSALYGACSAAVLVLTNSGAVFAQNTTEPATEAVTVTGSRVITNGLSAPTPVTVVTASQLSASSPSSIATALNYQPQFVGSAKTENTANSAGNVNNGANVLNLRRLGFQRTLVLLNGDRITPSVQTGATDVNALPAGLIERVDVVTGGASAAYGSDAVSGVVNFILDTDFVGFKGEFSGGASAGFSGGGNMAGGRLSLVWGSEFANGRGHIVTDFEYRYQDRPPNDIDDIIPWLHNADNFIFQPAGVFPTRIRKPNVHTANAAYGGLITSGPLKGIEFAPGGTPFMHDYGTTVGGGLYQSGGNSKNNQPSTGAGVMPSTQAFVRTSYDVSDSWTVFGEVLASNTKTSAFEYFPWHQGGNSTGIQIDNAFLPVGIRNAMVTNNITSFNFGRQDTEMPMFIQTIGVLLQGKVGFQGSVGDYKVDGGFTYGTNQFIVSNLNDPWENHYYAAVDSVIGPNGVAVCRATLTGNNPGCVPFNPFGQGSPSKDAINYVQATARSSLHYTRAHAYLNARRADLFNLWSTDGASAAVGFEYRSDTVNQNTDPISPSIVSFPGIKGFATSEVGKQGGFQLFNPQPFRGSYDVLEGFGEINIPIVSDIEFAKSLSLDIAGRVTGYSTSGTVSTWKLGLVHQVDDSIKFRLSASRDIRAPTLVDLYSPGLFRSGAAITDKGAASGFIFAQGPTNAGNPNLKPEAANTLTAGVVWTPTFLEGAYASVDWYHIDIHHSIGVIDPAQLIHDQCFNFNNQLACSNVKSLTYDGAGSGVMNFVQTTLNLGTQKREGMDFELGYTTEVGPGELTTRVLGTYLFKDRQTLSTFGFINSTGDLFHPLWSATANTTYTWNPLSLFLQARLFGGSTYNKTFVQGRDIDKNHVSAIVVADATVSYKLDWLGDSELYGTVNNVFDKSPPFSPRQDGSLNMRFAEYDIYDFVGRYVTVGLRFKM